MSLIHPSAVIHPEAQLGPGVEVGPFAVIEGPAIIGEGCKIAPHAVISGFVRMGARNIIGPHTVIGGEPQDLAFDASTESYVEIGDDNRIRELVTIHRGTAAGSVTRVGSHCYLMAGSHLGHNVTLGDRVILANNVLLGGYVEVADSVFIGGGAVFHQFNRIGRNVIVQGLAGASKNVPPFLIASGINTVAGLNVVGLRRAGFNLEQRREIKEAFVLVYRSGLNVSQALEAARERQWGPEAQHFFDFIAAAGKRGICALVEHPGDDE